MGKLIMVRHGESEGNAIRRFTTSGEAKITDLGRRQALEAAVRIKLKYQPILVIASTFARARETGAERIFRDARMMIVPDGTAQIQRLIIGQQLTGLDGFR